MRVFLSSTFKDLAEIRGQIESLIRKAGHDTTQMEFFGARPEAPLAVSLREAHSADLLVLVVGDRYGSIDPDTGLSITHLEFREANHNGIPVLAFISKHVDSEASTDPQLRKFIDEVKSSPKCTPDYFDSIESVPGTVVAALWRFVNQFGDPSRHSRVFAAAEQFFSPFLDPKAKFNHVYPLKGRDEEIASLKSFLKSDKSICVVVAAGGTGKSKLLYELATSLANDDVGHSPRIRFYRLGMALTTEAFRELPARNVCVVVDDAHRVENLQDFVQACRSHQTVSKMILTFRPGLVSAAERVLSTVAEGSTERIELKALNRKTLALDLARECLGSDRSHLADSLVKVADGNPLVITVGAHLLQKKGVLPSLLDRRNEFINVALGSLLDTIPDSLHGGVQRDKLLAILSAIQPFQPGDEAIRTTIALRLGVNPSDIVQSIDILARHGVILIRGNSARITPDVLGDNILFSASVSSSVASTGFIEEMLSAFGESHLSNIILNGAELDWRSEAEGKPIAVMSRAWERINELLPQSSHSKRARLLRGLAHPAYYAPKQVLQIVEWCIHNPEAPPDDDPWAKAVNINSQSVADEACGLLAIIGGDPGLIERCVRILWSLARVDDRNPNPRPDHPLRVLRNLAAYRTDNDLRTIEGLLSELDRIVDAGLHVNSKCPICEIIDESLEREVDFQESDRKSVTLGARPLDVKRVENQRNKALTILQKIALGAEHRSAGEAIRSQTKLLFVPHFKFGRETTPEDISGFRPEVERVINNLVEIGAKGVSQVTRYQAKRALLECEPEQWNGIETVINDAITKIPLIQDEIVFDAILHKPPARHARADWEEAETLADEACRSTATALWNKYASSDALISFFAVPLSEWRETGVHLNSGRFFCALAEAAGDRLVDFANRLMDSGLLIVQGQMLAPSLRILRERGLLSEFQTIASRGISSGNTELRRIISANMTYCFFGGQEPGDSELGLVEKMAKDVDLMVRASALGSLRSFRGTKRGAIRILVDADFGGDSRMADQALSCLSPNHGIDPKDLTHEDIDVLLLKLRNLLALDDHHGHITHFLEYATSRRPASVVRMLLGRIEDSTAAQNSFGDGYRAMPYLTEWLNLRNITDQNERISLLREVRDHILKESWQHSEYIPRLFRNLITDLDDAIKVIMEWGNAKDPSKVVAATKILRAMPESLLFSKHTEFADLLEQADRFGSDCYDKVAGNLHTLSMPKGARFLPQDGPDPFYVSQEATAAELANKYDGRPAVARFFNKLAIEARRWLEIGKREDEEDL